MRGVVDDLTGQKFGKLAVIEHAGKANDGHALWLCQCECGSKPIKVPSNALKLKRTTSCGCIPTEIIKKAGTNSATHGKRHTRLYNIWANMKQRCSNKNNPRYKDYGARGITVCDEWLHNFQSFYDWSMANGYKDDLTIDRKDNDGNYDPSNCKWSTYLEQSHNKRNYKREE